MNPEAALRAAGFRLIAGVDEAGRGAYAGPLVVAAVILDSDNPLTEVGDSKTFSESKRRDIAEEIKRAVGTKWAGHNIGNVTFVRPRRSMSQIGG